ncbi:hypothetical protein ACVIHC_005878 [Bradyrhizobium diazoefficiens]
MCPPLCYQRLRPSPHGSRPVRENPSPTASKSLTPGLSCRKSRFSSRRYKPRFEFSDRGHLLQHEAARWSLNCRKIGETHVHARIEQPLKKSHGSRKTIDLSNNERCLMHPRESQRLLQRRPVTLLTAFKLDELCDHLTASPTCVTRYCGFLRFDAEPRCALLSG